MWRREMEGDDNETDSYMPRKAMAYKNVNTGKYGNVR